jgi:hypothetical protein
MSNGSEINNSAKKMKQTDTMLVGSATVAAGLGFFGIFPSVRSGLTAFTMFNAGRRYVLGQQYDKARDDYGSGAPEPYDGFSIPDAESLKEQSEDYLKTTEKVIEKTANYVSSLGKSPK